MDFSVAVNLTACTSDIVLFSWFASTLLKVKRPLLTYSMGVLFLAVIPVFLGMFLTKAVLFPFAIIGFWLHLWFGYEGRLKEKILVYCLGYITINVTQMLCGSAFGVIGVHPTDHIIEFWVVCTLFEFAMLFLVSKTWRSIRLVISSVRFMTFFLLPISQLMMTVVFVYHFAKRDGSQIFDLMNDGKVALIFGGVFLLCLIADGVFLEGMARLAGDIREKERLQTLEMESELTYEYIKSMESDISEMSRYRHDFQNMLATVRMAISDGSSRSNEDALELVGQMTDNIGRVTGKRYCECNIVNCILALEEKKMTEEGIACELRAEVPERLGVNELDLCRVLTNLFDNARQHCAGVEGQGERYVSSNMRVCEGYLYIVVRNSCGEEPLTFETDKKDKRLHGLGLKIIRQIAERSGGELLIKQEDGAVTVTVTMEWKEQI